MTTAAILRQAPGSGWRVLIWVMEGAATRSRSGAGFAVGRVPRTIAVVLVRPGRVDPDIYP